MSVPTEVCVSVHLEALAAFGVQRDSLLSHGLEVLHEVDYHVPMRLPRILREPVTLMRCIGNVGPIALI